MAEVNIQKRLKDLIDSRTDWTYAIVWRYSSDHQSAIKWYCGYCKLLGTGKKTKEVRIFGSSVTVPDEEVTDAEWFFNISMAQSFVDLPERYCFLSTSFIWLTGSEQLLVSQWKRAKQAQEHGIQTLLLIPIPTGVMELGSTQLILSGLDYQKETAILIRRIVFTDRGILSSVAGVLEQIRGPRCLPERADNELQNRGHDNLYKQSRGKEKISASKCSWPLLTESSDRGTDRTFSYSHEYSGPS